MANLTLGVPYSGSLVASGGVPPYTFALIAGVLPPGLTLNTTTGAISGTPTATGNYPYTAQVTDSLGNTATASCLFVIAAGAPRGPGGPQWLLTKVSPTIVPDKHVPVRGSVS